VVASDIPAHREMLGADYPALAPRAPAGLAKAIAGVVGNRDLSEALGRRNRQRVADFDVAAMVAATARIYRDLLL
jgi:glycosyltransferase involved in cell wall biosynthesis